MTNKLPEVGSKWIKKDKSRKITVEYVNKKCVCYEVDEYSTQFCIPLEIFSHEFEPLEDNSQNAPRSANSEESISVSANNAHTDKGGREEIIEKPVVKDCLITDEVEKAKERLKQHLNLIKIYKGHQAARFHFEGLLDYSQALLDALDKQANIKTEAKLVADNKDVKYRNPNYFTDKIWNYHSEINDEIKQESKLISKDALYDAALSPEQIFIFENLITTIESMLERLNKLEGK